MSNIDKRALREAAERASTDNHTQDEWFHYLRCSTPETVLALLDELEAKDKRITELEAKLETADKLQDSSFRHGLQHGFSLGQTDNQAGFEQAIHAYGQQWKGE